jgi:hypothetical protein
MARVVVLIVAATVLAACAGTNHNVVDLIPHWAGGLPDNVPPRPGTPEYDAWIQQQQAEAARDKSKDPPKPRSEEKIPLVGGSSDPANPTQ